MPGVALGEGALLKDRYRLQRLLGRGGMASVWLADDLVLDRPVAVKVLADTISSDPEFVARFRREARVAAGLSHPNLVRVFDFAEREERPYLVMEYVAGDDLAQRIAAGGPIECERLARELLGALAHIHAAGIVHRDVKPQNLLLAADGSVKLIDFGIALPRDATALTQTGNLVGTARYMAPETMRGEPATPRSDLYSCGVVLRDCVDARGPQHLRALAERLAAPQPGARPASADEALARLERAPAVAAPTEVFRLESPEPPPRSPAQPAPARTVRSRPRLGRAAVALAAVASAAVAFALLAGDSGEEPGDSVRPQAAADGSASQTPVRDEREAAAVPAPSGEDPALGASLNEEGFELIQAGMYEEAVPVLEEAVRAFPAGTTEIEYAYALFNLGNALRLSGRPDDAIPVLERRLEIPNQTDVVRQELAAARSAAGP